MFIWSDYYHEFYGTKTEWLINERKNNCPNFDCYMTICDYTLHWVFINIFKFDFVLNIQNKFWYYNQENRNSQQTNNIIKSIHLRLLQQFIITRKANSLKLYIITAQEWIVLTSNARYFFFTIFLLYHQQICLNITQK